ncbi:hypothetical protein SNE40_013621 [Patella caerulea]|uniref:Uncharacterized protein n=2 Tax=Patella caerulea TaxID=87958 RepID=A0AAN8JGH5_PATCE
MVLNVNKSKMMLVCLGVVFLISSSWGQRNYDLEFICGQTLPVFDTDLVINGKASFVPSIIPVECIVNLESGYTDGAYRLQIIIEAIDIQDCAVNLDIFNGKGAFGNYLRQLSCRSMSTDTVYTESQFATIRLSRPYNLAENAYVFNLNIRAYKDNGESSIFQGGANLPVGAIVGIIIGLLALVLLMFLLVWCWKSGRLYDYTGWTGKNDDDEKEGKENFGVGNSDSMVTSSVASGLDHKDPSVWNTAVSGKYDPSIPRRSDGPQFLGGRRSYGRNGTTNGVVVTTAKNGDPAATYQKEQTDLKQLLNSEIRQGQGSRGRGQSARGEGGDSKETLIDDVFESDDNKNKDNRLLSNGGDDAYENVATSAYLKKKDSGNDFFKRGDLTRGSSRRGEDGSPTRGSLRRGDTGRGSNKSTGSHHDDMNKAKNLADEATAVKLKSSKSRSGPGGGDDRERDDNYGNFGGQVEPPSDFDSSSFMSVPEPATVTATVHGKSGPGGQSQKPTDKASDDSELNEINSRAKPGESEVVPNPNIPQNQTTDPHKSPNSKKKKKKKPKQEEVKDTLPPEAFEPLFDRPVSEEPYPAGMQPLNAGYNPYGVPGAMYPLQQYGMPYGMMPAPGTVPPGTQTYSYAYQTMPAPGAYPNTTPQQMAGKAAWIVQETPTKNGPVQKTSFMMATQESRPGSQQNQHHNGGPGQPSSSSTPYGRNSRPRNPGDTSVVPAGVMSPDNGQGHRTAMMKSGVDPVTGIETNQALWTDTTRDRTDPRPEDNPKINRKTVTRTTNRGGYGDLPQHVDNITDHLFISMDADDPAFLSPSGTGAHAMTSTETPEGGNALFYTGLHRGHGASPQHAIHPAPSRHNAIRDNISIA